MGKSLSSGRAVGNLWGESKRHTEGVGREESNTSILHESRIQSVAKRNRGLNKPAWNQNRRGYAKSRREGKLWKRTDFPGQKGGGTRESTAASEKHQVERATGAEKGTPGGGSQSNGGKPIGVRNLGTSRRRLETATSMCYGAIAVPQQPGGVSLT